MENTPPTSTPGQTEPTKPPISNIQSIYPTPQSSPPEPALTEPSPPPTPNRSKARLVTLLIVLIVSIGALGWHFDVLEKIGLVGTKAKPSTLRVYKTPIETDYSFGITRDSPTRYVLTDAQGKQLQILNFADNPRMITPLGDDGFLFVTDKLDTLSSPNAYIFLGRDGLIPVPNIPESMAKLISTNTTPRIGGIDRNTIVYQYCKDINEIKQDEDAYQCDLRFVDLASGIDQKVVQPDSINDAQAKLLAFSTDKKYAYFMGLTKADRDELQKKVSAITGSQLMYEDDPRTEEIYKLTMNPSIFKVNLFNHKVISTRRIEVRYNYYNKFWISPDGEHTIYADGGSGQIYHVSISNNKQTTIKLPSASQASEPWGGETTTYNPLYSLDGDYMAYVTYDFSTGKDYLGMINLNTLTAQTITERQMGEYGSMDDPSFDNMRWYPGNQLELTFDNENYRLDANTSKLTKLDKTHGLLFGLADGAR